jgi:uncharacterized membrane protein
VVIVLWIGWNTLAPREWRFDPYTFTFLTLVLSLQASYAAPLILLAQTRQADRDKVHTERMEKAHSRLEHAAKTETDKLLELLQSNTDLTEEDKALTSSWRMRPATTRSP